MTPLQTGGDYINLEPGDPAPHFAQRGVSDDFNLSNLGGGFIAMAFILSSALGVGKAVLDIILAQAGIFDDEKARFIAVTYDHNDAARLKGCTGFQVVLDFDGKVARRYGVLPARAPPGATRIQFRPRLIILDRRLRVVANIELRPDGSDAARIIPEILALPALAAAEPDLTPPILVVPRVFSPELCRQLIAGFEAEERPETGIVIQVGDRTTVVLDQDTKRRRDYEITEPDLIATLKSLLRRRLLPEIAKAFQFQISHVERHIISRYTAEERGHFRAHRDNTARATAYRRFATTINLNSEYEGGTLSFPEFGPQSVKPPPGGAVVFSCSLLHTVSLVTSGVRYAYLPFFYDDAAVKILEEGRASWTHSELDQTARVATRI
jgi:predicted 2-oxoglutarate/Fe(II)-dependent dioxygenase YbiX